MAWQFEKVLRTNYALNPAYRVGGGGTTACRTNVHPNPSFGAASIGTTWGVWYGYGTPTGTFTQMPGSDTPRVVAGYGRVTWTAAPTSGGGVTSGSSLTISPSTAYTISVFVRPSITLNMYASGQFYNSGAPTGSFAGTTTTCPANQWTRVWATGWSAASDNQIQTQFYVSGAGVLAGTTLDADDCLIEAADTLMPYFDGSSKLNLCATPSSANSNNGASYPAYSDPGVSRTGNLGSTRSDPTTGPVVMSVFAPGGFTTNTPFTVGTTYTFSTWVKTQCGVDCTAVAYFNTRDASGTNTATYGTYVNVPANSTGWYQVTVTATAPANAVLFFPIVTVTRTSGVVVPGYDHGWITDSLMEAGATAPGPFYRGLTPTWAGTANASASYLIGEVPSAYSTAKIYTYLYGQSQFITGDNSYCIINTRANNTVLTMFTVSAPTVASPGEYWSGRFEARVVPNSGPALTISPRLFAYSSSSAGLGATTDLTAAFTLPADGSWQSISVVSAIPLPDTTYTLRWYVTENPTASGGQILEVRNFLLEKVSGPGVPAGTYFDGASPSTAKPLTYYRFTGAADTTTSEKYLPQQILPVVSDSRSAQVGYQGTYTVDGIDIQNFAFGISKVAHAVPELRGSHTTLPGRSGVMARANRSYDAAELALSMWIVGCEPDGSVPGTYTQRYALFKRNLTALLQLFGAQNGTSTLTWTPADPAMPSLVTRIIANGVSSLDTMMARQRAELTVSMTVVDAFWKSRVPVTESSPLSTSLPHNIALANTGSAPVEDAIITITGPVAIPRVTCQASGTWVQYNGNLEANKKLIIDSGAGTATIDGVSVMSQITHGGHPLLMYIPPRNAGIDSISAMSLAPNMQLSGSGGASSTTFSVTYNSKFLVGI